ncbi:MAG TPA: SufD family Fe-S cluster assembly protein [Candidatus Saccharimonadales bacterium]|nr:SufD family Fe-S cluster assembly protein [Candidatus Saccharimonadales bacterium]
MVKKIVVKKNEEKIFPFVWIDGKEKEVSINATLLEGASLQILGVFLGTKNNAMTFNTNVVHKGKKTKSLTTLRGVFLNNSSFNNDGMVHIKKGASGADGYFTSKILLFDDAKGRSVPSLEIDENDLKAGHASTVGRPDKEQLFYLQSRGLSEKEAEKLIVSGFFEPILLMLPKNDQEKTRTQLAAAIQ